MRVHGDVRERPQLAPSSRPGAGGNGRKGPHLSRSPNRPAAPAICAKQSLRAKASIAIRSLRGPVGGLVKVTFQATNG